MTAWREEDHPRDAAGRFTVKGMMGAVSIKRTLAHVQSAPDEALLDVFGRINDRIGRRGRMSRSDERALIELDEELQRREAGGEPEPTPEQKRVDELLARGYTYEDAYREAYGREGVDDNDGAHRRKGETREQARRREYAEMTYLTMLQAESWTRGNLLTKEAQSAGIAAASLFSGPRARAEKYASEELRRFWAEVAPRRTYAEYRAEAIGDTGGQRKARAKRVQAGNGKDHGA